MHDNVSSYFRLFQFSSLCHCYQDDYHNKNSCIIIKVHLQEDRKPANFCGCYLFISSCCYLLFFNCFTATEQVAVAVVPVAVPVQVVVVLVVAVAAEKGEEEEEAVKDLLCLLMLMLQF